ncbi:E3 ubiquitin-protein ligase RNF146 [Drosophila novamexicana]|uniref:E3 ubiquitin-protein ligase RNF146 n=1 Tax=Drosophila novamexicana TaxID=47314 RepID=UPI0011E5FD47|nr:E3 ubiquitin-protein ligase RNF146 [Drosophila novamexicana]
MKQKNNCSKCNSASCNNSTISSWSTEDLCAFCLDHIHDPVQLPCCMHQFCRSCLRLYREARSWQAKRCPLCRRSLEAFQTLDPNEAHLKRLHSWRLTFVLLLGLMLFSLGPFFLLLIYW